MSVISPTSPTTSLPGASVSAAPGLKAPSQFKVVGVILAVASGLLIGSSFVFKKKGLLRSQAGHEAGEGVAYLKSPLWWTGMTMMILGEICNFVAYAFVEAIVVTPLGALSVVICAILSSIFLKEKLTFFGWLGCGLCIVGSVVIALNGPQEETVGQIREFQKLFLAPGFLVWGGLLIAASVVIVVFFAPKYGKKSMLWYIFVCSMIGGLSVSCTTGLGAAIVTSVQGDNQFKHWFTYFLLCFVAVTLVTEVIYLNKALALFNTAMVTPTYYVIFTFFTLVTTVILFQGLKSTVMQILTIVCGFLTICAGITILQMSKIDPEKLDKLDRRSTLLLKASRNDTEMAEKSISGMEDPGIDALRGSFGAMGSMIRARSVRKSLSQQTDRSSRTLGGDQPEGSQLQNRSSKTFQRHQLYDPPVPRYNRDDSVDAISLKSNTTGPPRTPTIKFDSKDIAHYYPQPGASGNARHEFKVRDSGVPPILPVPSDGSPSSRRVGDGMPNRKEGSTVPTGPGLPMTAPPAASGFFDPGQPYSGEFDPTQMSTPKKQGSPSRLRADSDTQPDNGKRKTPRRNYPRTGGADDTEESIGLVNKESSNPFSRSSDSMESTVDPENNSSIRLVTSSTTKL